MPGEDVAQTVQDTENNRWRHLAAVGEYRRAFLASQQDKIASKSDSILQELEKLLPNDAEFLPQLPPQHPPTRLVITLEIVDATLTQFPTKTSGGANGFTMEHIKGDHGSTPVVQEKLLEALIKIFNQQCE